MQYDAIVRIFVLPKSNNPHTLIVISLDPPIRKGQTHYPHILIQFHSEEETTMELEISDEVFEAKNQAVRSPAHHPNSMVTCFPHITARCSALYLNLEGSCIGYKAGLSYRGAVRRQVEQAVGGAGL